MSYRDIKADVLRRITSGQWPPGHLIPSELELCDEYGSARATVNRALRELADEGVLDRKRKSGTRVRAVPLRQARFDIPLTRLEVEGNGASYRYALVKRAVEPAPDWLRARMGLQAGAQVVQLTCMHFADGTPFQHEARWINLEALPQAREQRFEEVGPNEWLVETVPFSDVEIGFSAVSASEELAGFLGCQAGEALFQMERSTWFEGKAVTYVRMCFQPGYRMKTSY